MTEKNKKILKLTGIISFLSFIVIGQFQNCSDVSFSTVESGNQKSGDVDPRPDNPNFNKSESFKFGPGSNKIDILVVVDNSGSMAKEQRSLGSGFNNFISSLTKVDWQIGVTTTDADLNNNGRDAGKLIGPANLASTKKFGTEYIITPSTTDAAEKFAQTVQRVTAGGSFLSGSGDEQAIRVAHAAIDGRDNPDKTLGLFRENSNLAIVILSDEDERSCGNNPTAPGCSASSSQFRAFVPENYPQSLVNKVKTEFDNTKALLVNAFVIKPNDTHCYNLQNDSRSDYGSGGKYGFVYSELVNLTNGVLGSICDNGVGGFTSDLNNISESIYQNINPETILLAHTPKSTPLVTITYDAPSAPSATDLTYQWVEGTNKIIFNRYPASTSIRVDYEY